MAKRRVTIEELEDILNSADNRYRIKLLPDGGIEAIDTYTEPNPRDEEIAKLKGQLVEKEQEIERLRRESEIANQELIMRDLSPNEAVRNGPAGEWMCPECDFMLHNQVIDISTGEIGTPIVEEVPECMNGCGTMRPFTWKNSEVRWAVGQEALLLRAEEAEKKLMSLHDVIYKK